MTSHSAQAMLNATENNRIMHMNTNWEKVISESQLISLPEVYIKLQQIISSDDYALSDIVDVISFDPAISARLLRMVNSSFFGLETQIDTIGHAINYLGTKQVNDLVLTTSLADTFSAIDNPEFSLHQFWRHSVYCAISARELALSCGIKDAERLFLIGLLHDIGHLMMHQSLAEPTHLAELIAQQQQIPLHQSEQQQLGFDSAQLGAELLNNWNLPSSLVEVIRYQFNPSNAESFQLEASILHISITLTELFKQEQGISEQTLKTGDENALQICGIRVEDCTGIDKLAQQQLGSVLALLFPYQR